MQHELRFLYRHCNAPRKSMQYFVLHTHSLPLSHVLALQQSMCYLGPQSLWDGLN